MNPVIAVLLVAAIANLCWIVPVSRRFWPKDRMLTIVATIVSTLVIWGIGLWSLTSYSLIRSDLMYLNASNQIVGVGTYWRWSPVLDNTKQVEYNATSRLVCQVVQPITPNPKVRQIIQNAEISLGGTPESMAAALQVTSGHTPYGWLRYQMFEFQERNSRKLAKFYNPVDESQQKEYYRLVYNFLKRDLKRGQMKLKASFELPDPNAGPLTRY